MTKRITSLFILALLLVAFVAIMADANRIEDEMAAKLRAYAEMTPNPGDESGQSVKGSTGTALGSYADGGSPGAVVLHSFADHPLRNSRVILRQVLNFWRRPCVTPCFSTS